MLAARRDTERLGRTLQPAQALDVGGEIRMPEHGHAGGLRDRLLEQLELRLLPEHVADARRERAAMSTAASSTW